MILVPAMSLEDWKKLVPDPDEQWKPGSPANALAASWHGLMRFPREISALFSAADATRGATLLLAIPEHQVPLAGGERASQTDLWLLARTPTGLLSVVVEGKVSESFGPSVGDWQAGETPGRRERWAALCGLLEIEPACDLSIRSQLIHRTASALLEARRFCARGAAVIVHSFSLSGDGFGDFQHFVKVMGGFIKAPGTLVAVPPREGIDLFFGWAQGPVLSDTSSC